MITKLAEQKAAQPDIKQYARTAAYDHERLNAALDEIAEKDGVSLPFGMQQEQEQEANHLESLQGAAFGRAYLQLAKELQDQNEDQSQG